MLVIRRREDLLEHVIPFFERTPLLSGKQQEFETFARPVGAMEFGHHRTDSGFQELLTAALSMNGAGRHRRVRWQELISTHPESSESARQTGAPGA